MNYRIRLDLPFIAQDAVDDILDKALDHLGDAVIINQGQDHEERGYITIEKCYHDENPALPCEVIETHLVPYN